jgi:hypothetical protein
VRKPIDLRDAKGLSHGLFHQETLLLKETVNPIIIATHGTLVIFGELVIAYGRMHWLVILVHLEF